MDADDGQREPETGSGNAASSDRPTDRQTVAETPRQTVAATHREQRLKERFPTVAPRGQSWHDQQDSYEEGDRSRSPVAGILEEHEERDDENKQKQNIKKEETENCNAEER